MDGRPNVRVDDANFGCPCKSVCPPTPNMVAERVACDDPQYQGWNSPDDEPGECLNGTWAGCSCSTSCPTNRVTCDSPQCNGFNGNKGKGICLSGNFQGCPCVTVCNEINGQNCTSIDGCNALRGSDAVGGSYCLGGKYNGCACNGQCPNPPGPCSDPSCQGAVNPNVTYAVCETGILIGCDCDPTK